MVNFGIGYTDVFVSVWSAVMTLTHNKQREISASFCKASSVGLDNCAGAIAHTNREG